MLIGAWIVIYLFLGFTPVWDKIFALICGISIIAIAYTIKTEVKQQKEVPFIEHKTEIKTMQNNTVYPQGYSRTPLKQENDISRTNNQYSG